MKKHHEQGKRTIAQENDQSRRNFICKSAVVVAGAVAIRTAIISPGAVATELLNGISDPAISAATRARTALIAVPADSFARAVAFAISQPAELDINEILFRPTNQEW